MLKKGSKLNSILTGSCPTCQEESMYLDKNPYNITNVYKMHENCSHCGTKYKMEPSFFYGAMYVSYALGIAFGVAAFGNSWLDQEPSVDCTAAVRKPLSEIVIEFTCWPFQMKPPKLPIG